MATASANGSKSTEKSTETTDAAAVQAQLDALRQDVAELSRTLAAYGKAQKDHASSAARAQAEKLRGDAEAGLAEAELRARQAYGQAENTVRENPGAAVAVAGGIGFLVGLFMSRR